MTTSLKIVGAGNDNAVKALSVDDFFDYLQNAEAGGNNPQSLYGKVAWLFRAVSLRASAMAGMPYTVWQGEEEYDFDEAVTRLNKLLMLIESDLCLSGAAYALKRRIFPGSSREELADLKRLNPWTVRVLTDPKPEHGLTDDVDGIYGFRYQVNAEKPNWYAPDRVLYFDHLYNPKDDLGPGVAPASVCGIPAELVYHMNEYASAFFERGAVIPFALSTDTTIPVGEQERLKNLFKRMYTGVKNFFKVLLLQHGLTVQQLGSPPSDLAMPDLEDSAKKQVAAALGIPPAMLEQQDASHATAMAHQLSFYTETMLPEADMIADTFNTHLFDDMGLRLEFDKNELEVIQKQESEKAQHVTAIIREMRESASAGILEKWEARHYLDELMNQMQMPRLEDIEKPADWEDEPEPPPMMPPQFQVGGNGNEPPEETRSKKVTPPAGEPGPPEGLWSELAKWRKKAEGRADLCDFESDVIPDWLKVQVVAAQEVVGDDAFLFLKQEQSRGVVERRIKRKIRAVLREFQDKAEMAIVEGRSFPYEELRRKLKEVLGPQIQVITTNQILQIASEVGVAFDPAFVNHRAARWARDYTYELVDGLTETTRNVVQDAMSTYIETPEMDLADLKKQLEQAFNTTRAERIAVTETTRAYEQATMQYQQLLRDESGLEMMRVWHTAADDIICPVCAPLDLKPESDWPQSHSDGPPAHVNCRCFTGLSARPVSHWRERHKERQEMLAEQVGAEFAGSGAGGQV